MPQKTVAGVDCVLKFFSSVEQCNIHTPPAFQRLNSYGDEENENV